ncbi:MAG: hypothetical protein ABI723_04840 [Bacteroidia bacterium]
MSILKTIYNVFHSTFFRPDKFYCRVDLGGGIIYKVYERPGKWMKEKDLKSLTNDIHTIAISGQGEKEIPDYGVLKGNTHDLKNRVITIGYEKKTGRPVGFAAQIFLDVPLGLHVTEVLHLGLVFVAKDYQKKSVLGMLYILPNILLLIKSGFRPIWISNVSQVPSVIGVVSDYYAEVYPDPIHITKQSLMQKALAGGIMQNHRNAFGTGDDAIYDEEKQIIYNSYTGGSDNLKKSFDESPKYRVEIVNEFCKVNLDYERGDDFLQIGILSGKLIQNFFVKRVSGVSRLQWFLYLFVAGILTVMLPILQWLTRKNK